MNRRRGCRKSWEEGKAREASGGKGGARERGNGSIDEKKREGKVERRGDSEASSQPTAETWHRDVHLPSVALSNQPCA
jgi:hypothetical protein